MSGWHSMFLVRQPGPQISGVDPGDEEDVAGGAGQVLAELSEGDVRGGHELGILTPSFRKLVGAEGDDVGIGTHRDNASRAVVGPSAVEDGARSFR
jgi:hypothetical protein